VNAHGADVNARNGDVSTRRGIVAAILAKDLRAFARDRFYVSVSILGLVAYVLLFWLLPATVEETVPLGVHLEGAEPFLTGLAGASDGLDVVAFDDPIALVAAVESGDEIVAGLDFPPGFLAAVAAGGSTTVRVLLPADAPEELRPALTALVRELAYLVAGETPPVTAPALDEAVVGVDRSGAQVSLREQLRPMLVFLVLLVEMFALASLIAAEIHQRTITAILVTPARVSDVLAAKSLLGTGLAFGQALLILLATGTFVRGWTILALALLLGSILVTGMAMIAGSLGRDFIGIVFWSMLFMIPLTVPAFTVLFPGSAATWVQALPTYGLVSVIVGVTAYGDGWAQVGVDLLVLAGWCLVAFGVGVLVLRRRVARV
jgi:ABC-2 type transport system permease protein